jgi:hypothetical protein
MNEQGEGRGLKMTAMGPFRPLPSSASRGLFYSLEFRKVYKYPHSSLPEILPHKTRTS